MCKAKLLLALSYLFVICPFTFAQTLFTDKGQHLGEYSAWSVSLQDLDGDKDLDACIDGQIWINNGKGIFSKSDKSFGGSTTTFGDLNGDKLIDAVCDSSIFLNDGKWNFVKQPQTFGSNSKGAWLLDLDNDKDLDAIVYTDTSDRIWFNNGTGKFTDSGISLGGWGQCKYEAGDVNKDGFTDIVVAIPHTPPPAMNENINDKIWLGDKNGYFTEKVLISTNFQTRSTLLCDFDGDGDLDLFMGKGFLVTGGINWCKILFNDGSGNFTDSGQKLNTGYNSSDAKLADLDNDGDMDIFIINGMPTDNGQPNTVWLNDGKGNFTDAGLRLGSSNSMALALGDIDGDLDIDALVGNVEIKTNLSFTNVYLNTTKSSTGIKTDKVKDKTYYLNQNYPNPFNPSTTINYQVADNSVVKLKIYNILGKEIKTLVDSFQHTGEYNVTWDGTDNSNIQVSSGVYLCRLEIPDKAVQMKMVLSK